MAKLKIGWSAYLKEGSGAVGFGWTNFVFDRLKENNIDVVWLNGESPMAWIPTGTIDDCDILFCVWRWEMPDYPERNAAFERQMALIGEATDRGIPVLVHDQDKLIGEDEYRFLLMNNVWLFAPDYKPDPNVNQLFFPHSYLDEKLVGYDAIDFSYIGNNTGDRLKWIQHYFTVFAKMGFDVRLYGNWLDPHPSRLEPAEVVKKLPQVMIGQRVGQEEMMKILADSSFTMHFAADRYYRNQTLTLRWAEAAMAGTIAFLPQGFCDDLSLTVDDKVTTIMEIAKMKRALKPDIWEAVQWELVSQQRQYIYSMFTTRSWIDLFESFENGNQQDKFVRIK